MEVQADLIWVHIRLKGKELECLVPGTKHLHCSVGGRNKGRCGTIQALAKRRVKERSRNCMSHEIEVAVCCIKQKK